MYSYSFKNGWEETDFYISGDGFDEIEDAYRAADFYKVHHSQDEVSESFFNTEVYVFDGSYVGRGHGFKFIVSLNLVHHIEDIMVPDLPSLVELMSKLSSTNIASIYKESESERISNDVRKELKSMRR